MKKTIFDEVKLQVLKIIFIDFLHNDFQKLKVL